MRIMQKAMVEFIHSLFALHLFVKNFKGCRPRLQDNSMKTLLSKFVTPFFYCIFL